MPKQKLAASVALLTTLLVSGCGASLTSDKTLTLQVTGTKGTPITGEYILTEGTNITRHRLERVVPFSIEVIGKGVSCVLQKLGDEGTVRVQLLVDGELVAFARTKERYGNVSVDTP